jgi:predicted DCC family thiol-disulfide oxidoreductase YuxK
MRLRWPWPLLYAGLLVPRFLRDWAYEAFAARRYWFGQSDSCRIPTPELRRRFVG